MAVTGHKRRPLEAGVEAVRTQPNASNTNSGRGQRGFGAQISISGGRPQQNNYIDIDRDHVVSARPRLDDYNDSGRNRKRMAPLEIWETGPRATLSELGLQHSS